MDGRRDRAAVARGSALGARTMRRLMAGLAVFGMLWALAGCAAPTGGAAGDGQAPATTAAARARAAQVKQRDSHFSGRQLKLAVYYLRTFEGRR